MRKIYAWLPLLCCSAAAYAEGGHWQLGTGLAGYSYSTYTTNWADSDLVLGGREDVAETQALTTVGQNLSLQYMNNRWGFRFVDNTTNNQLSGFFAIMPNVYAEVDLSMNHNRTRNKKFSVVTDDTKNFVWALGAGARYYHQHDTCIMDMGGVLQYGRAYNSTYNSDADSETTTNLKVLNLELHANYYRAVMDHLYVGGGLTLSGNLSAKQTKEIATTDATTSGDAARKGYALDLEIVGIRVTF